MVEPEIPMYRCTSCLQAIPEDMNQHSFGGEYQRPTSDDAENFVTEAQTILGYASAVAAMLHEAPKIGEEVLFELHSLVGALTEEARRRLARVQDALEIVWKREEEAKKASHVRKAGV